jgi:hypothetical protein
MRAGAKLAVQRFHVSRLYLLFLPKFIACVHSFAPGLTTSVLNTIIARAPSPLRLATIALLNLMFLVLIM